MIGIVNYGSGNVRAIGNIYDKLLIPYKIVSDITELNDCTKLILPGVGSFDETMNTLNNSGFKTKLEELVNGYNIPVLGICVGMQILSNGSDEGKLPGLGWIPGNVKKINKELLKDKPKLPHLGWNSIEIKKEDSIMNEVDYSEGFYFIHSYYYECLNVTDILATTKYGVDFASAISRGNIYGMQFHPEKSHSNGIKLLQNFSLK